MLVFIDESGDTGLEIAAGATRHFVVVMVAFSDHNEAIACEDRIRLLRRELGLDEKFEFHFHKNSDRVREAFFKAIVPYDFFYYGIIIKKAQLFGEGFRNKESFYKYACGLLFENAKEKLADAIVVIDKSGRELFKYQLASYLKKKINGQEHIRIRKVKMQDSHRNDLLQCADMVCGAVFRSLAADTKDVHRFRRIVQSREIYVQMWPK